MITLTVNGKTFSLKNAYATTKKNPFDKKKTDVVVVPLDPLLNHRRKDTFDTRALLDPRLHRQLAQAVWPRVDLLRRRGIQIVHTNSMKAHILGGVSGRAARVKVLWHVRDHIAPPYLPAGAARAMRIAARLLPHHVVAVSASAARTVGRRDVTVLHQSVPLPELNGERPANGRVPCPTSSRALLR